MERCSRIVSIQFPCALSNGHTGVCQPDPEGQLRIYGITVEDLRQIQSDLHDARRLGLIRNDGEPTPFMRYVKLRAALVQITPRGGGGGFVRVADLQRAISESES